MTPELLVHAVSQIAILVLSITVHEYAHALAAHKLGDDLGRRQGRLTLNPIAHADPVGTLLLPLLGILSGGGGFGWGRPVQYMPRNLTRKYSLRGCEAIIAFAGPLANLLMAILCAVLSRGLINWVWLDFHSPFGRLLWSMVGLNLSLFFFNLLPFPPLDGSKVAAWLFGRRADPVLNRLSGMGGASFLIALGFGWLLLPTLVGFGLRALDYLVF